MHLFVKIINELFFLNVFSLVVIFNITSLCFYCNRDTPSTEETIAADIVNNPGGGLGGDR